MSSLTVISADSQQTIDRLMGDIPAEERHKIVAGNVTKLYGFN